MPSLSSARLIPFYFLLAAVFVGCENQSEVNVNEFNVKMTIATPVEEGGGQSRLSEYEGAGLEVRVNDGPAQFFPRQMAESWSFSVEGVRLNELNSIELLWNLTVDGQRYDVATQSDTFLASPDTGPYSVVSDYVSEIYDHDNDLVSNLTEINAGGFPVSETNLPEVVSIEVQPPGCFTIGSPVAEHAPFGYDNEIQAESCIGSSYAIGKYEVTYDMFDVFANANRNQDLPSDNSWGRGNLPVINVTWDDAAKYVSWLSTITGKSYRLPTEAEWEYAARANTTTPFYTGATIHTGQANFSDRTTPDATSVFYSAANGSDTTIVGVFRLTDVNRWEERGIDIDTGAETLKFAFDELRRDDDGIHLYDSDRGIAVRLSVASGQIYLDFLSDPQQTATTLFYLIAASPLPVGQRTLPVGSFAANRFGLHDMHGNVFEWTCSIQQNFYGGAQNECVDRVPENALMIKRSGSWGSVAKDVRSANRGWNNTQGISDIFTGFRVVLEE